MSLKNNAPEKKILMANGHAILRETLGQVIAEIPDVVLVAVAKNGNEVMAMINKYDLDLVILDIDMPDRNCLEILKKIKNDIPDLPVLILNMLPEKQYAVSMLKAGADGYITMENLADQMREAIQSIFQGEKYFNASLLREAPSALFCRDMRASIRRNLKQCL
jgi:two-component system, NarL family, invasion response regulator UvrY